VLPRMAQFTNHFDKCPKCFTRVYVQPPGMTGKQKMGWFEGFPTMLDLSLTTDRTFGSLLNLQYSTRPVQSKELWTESKNMLLGSKNFGGSWPPFTSNLAIYKASPKPKFQLLRKKFTPKSHDGCSIICTGCTPPLCF
jgi:hypothetical protein